MVKGIINAFDHTEWCLVINLTKSGNWAVSQPPIFATGYVSFATTFYTRLQVLDTCIKKLISNTAYAEIQIRGGIENNSKIIFHIFQ